VPYIWRAPAILGGWGTFDLAIKPSQTLKKLKNYKKIPLEYDLRGISENN
jgi:hypothetical protein